MSDTVILYNLQKRDYPNKRGDVFRSTQVFECDVCHALTNEVVMGGYPGYGVRVICPNSCECWHHVLEHKLTWLKKPHPKVYSVVLSNEIEIFREKYRGRVRSDLVGSPDLSQKRGGVTNTMSHRKGSFCEHFFGLGSYDEASIERAEEARRKASKQLPDSEFEALIASENPHVRAQARASFYGFDLHRVLFPEDDFGPKFDGADSERAFANAKRVNEIDDWVRKSPRLLARTKKFRGISVD
jgi:hypothetical protein